MTQPDERLARELLAKAYEAGGRPSDGHAAAYIRSGHDDALVSFHLALRAITAALQSPTLAEREAVEGRLRLSLWNHLRALGKNQDVCINLINKIVAEVLPDPPGDHIPQRGEAEHDG